MKGLLLIISVAADIFLTGCVTTKPPAPSQEELTSLIRNHLVLLEYPDFEPVVSRLKNKEIVFLGEVHHVEALIQTGGALTVALAKKKPAVWAHECCYSTYPLMEAISMGKEENLIPWNCPETIQSFNSTHSSEKKILMTAVDIEYSVYKHKPGTVRFLQFLASRSSSESATKILNKKIAFLTEQDTFNKMNEYLKDLDCLFRRHFETFSSEDQEEILFYIDLLKASNRYGYLNQDNDWKKSGSRFWKVYNIRYRYFNKTIERAYEKARKCGGILICQLGEWHIDASHRCEAQYFERKYRLTKGKTASIRLIPLYSDQEKNHSENIPEIDITVKNLMGNSRYGYLDLNELTEDAVQMLAWSDYFTHDGPKYDGLLFIHVNTNAESLRSSTKANSF